MNSQWWTYIIIFLVVLFITGIVLCKAFLKDYKYINRLTSPVYPEIIVVNTIEDNMPIANGVLVQNINEDLNIIDV